MPPQTPKPDPGRLEEIFHRALAIPSDDRELLLDQLCEGDTALRACVERLLRSAEMPGGATLLDSGAINM